MAGFKGMRRAFTARLEAARRCFPGAPCDLRSSVPHHRLPTQAIQGPNYKPSKPLILLSPGIAQSLYAMIVPISDQISQTFRVREKSARSGTARMEPRKAPEASPLHTDNRRHPRQDQAPSPPYFVARTHECSQLNSPQAENNISRGAPVTAQPQPLSHSQNSNFHMQTTRKNIPDPAILRVRDLTSTMGACFVVSPRRVRDPQRSRLG